MNAIFVKGGLQIESLLIFEAILLGNSIYKLSKIWYTIDSYC